MDKAIGTVTTICRPTGSAFLQGCVPQGRFVACRENVVAGREGHSWATPTTSTEQIAETGNRRGRRGHLVGDRNRRRVSGPQCRASPLD